MSEPMTTPDYWRDRAEKTRALANRFQHRAGEKERLLRIAEEYDNFAKRAADLQNHVAPLKD